MFHATNSLFLCIKTLKLTSYINIVLHATVKSNFCYLIGANEENET